MILDKDHYSGAFIEINATNYILQEKKMIEVDEYIGWKNKQ